MSEIIRPLTPQETCAMYHYHNEYAALGIGAIAYYKGLSLRDKSFIDDMTAAILKAAQHRVQADCLPCGHPKEAALQMEFGSWSCQMCKAANSR